MTARRFTQDIAEALQCDAQRAESVIFAVFRELSHRLTAHEAADVASQLPLGLKRLWNADEGPDRPVEKIHRDEFIGRVRRHAVLSDEQEAERAVRAVFRALQRLLGSPTGRERGMGHLQPAVEGPEAALARRCARLSRCHFTSSTGQAHAIATL
jgi:uncharacterized protein (DUF2267 family)